MRTFQGFRRPASFSGRTRTGPGEAREVMTMWPRYLLALCLVLALTSCATYSGNGYYYPYGNYYYPYNYPYPTYYSPYYYYPYGYYYNPHVIRPRVPDGHKGREPGVERGRGDSGRGCGSGGGRGGRGGSRGSGNGGHR